MNTEPTAEKDELLTQVLQGWVVDAQLPPRFEEGVWRRIARVEDQATASPWATLLDLVANSLGRPKVAWAFAAVLLAFGVIAGTWTAQVQRSHLETALGERYVHSVDPYQVAMSHR